MKIPFIQDDIEVTQERLDFIKNTRGGSAGIFAGAIFWILAVIILSNLLFAFLYPLVVIIQSADLTYVPPAIGLINAAHILIFMWVHYEFFHLILAGLAFLVSCVFIFIFPEMSYIGVGSLSAIINIIFGYLIFKSTGNPLSEYKYKVIEKNIIM